MIGQHPDGEPAYSVASQLKQEGWGVGIMSSVPVDHAYKQMMRKQATVKTLYEDINVLVAKALSILSHKAGVGWVGENHTAAAVPIFAIGVGAERFTGWHDNSEIAPLIYQATRE